MERSIDDVIAGVIRFSLGGQPFAMAVIPMGAHDRWQESLNADTAAQFEAVPDEGPGRGGALRKAVLAGRDRMVDALIDYDRDKVLPTREEIFELATGQEIFAAIGEVVAVGGDPFGLIALTAARRRMSHPTGNGSTRPPGPTKRSRPSTGGRSRKSGRR